MQDSLRKALEDAAQGHARQNAGHNRRVNRAGRGDRRADLKELAATSDKSTRARPIQLSREPLPTPAIPLGGKPHSGTVDNLQIPPLVGLAVRQAAITSVSGIRVPLQEKRVLKTAAS